MTPLFLILGDSFLRTQKTKTLTDELQKKSKEPLAVQRLRLTETSLEEVLAAARTLPFFSPGQILLIQDADLLKEDDVTVLASYLANPSAQTTLIFEADEIKANSELQKLAKSKGQVFAFAKEDAKTMGAAFLQQKLAQSRKTMTPPARARVLAMCGDAVVFLDTMVERLVQFAGEKTEIDETMVSQFEENWTEMDVFKLTNALVDHDPARALKVFQDLMEHFEADLVSVIGILHWQLKQLWQASLLMEQGISEREIGSKLRMPPARLGALRKFPRKSLESAIEALYQIDRHAKTGQWDGIASLEAWLLQYAA